ncbi:hypothetical protein KK062_27120 [Fulvivirgaceae bacterium PWU5]|uniref:Uncharacterized protein n=1 Tax=Dawidia cretensis TaxID=2782350 RepID=A0AAP2GT90_9BACT|nr:DUF6520 family protein [Dawidia cretensis]MBT1711944.1 hypothetical protein [Dawidia cretensis]
MKSKNVILGTVAVLFAIGGSFASSLLVPGEYAKQGVNCRAITTTCDVAGGNLCNVRITNVTPNVILPVYDDPACLIRTNTTSQVPINGQFE